jgi:hypothetical protein
VFVSFFEHPKKIKDFSYATFLEKVAQKAEVNKALLMVFYTQNNAFHGRPSTAPSHITALIFHTCAPR